MITTSRQARTTAFAALCLVSLAGAGVYLYARARAVAPTARPVVDVRDPDHLEAVRSRAHVVFRNMEPGPEYGVLSFVPLDDTTGRRATTTLGCLRAYHSAGTTLCLAVDTHPGRPYHGYLLNGDLRMTQAFDVPGLPSRTRVGPDGSLAAYTVFTGRDSYMATGFSTRTRLVDVASGRALADLEEFTAFHNGVQFSSVDFNYWGVTFTRDPGRFYATLGTGGHTYLVEGSLAERRVTVIADGIECPSLSPDGRRIAFKKKVKLGAWQPAIFDLERKSETVLPETRSVDDQIEWLDDTTVLYAIRDSLASPRRANIWKISADGRSQPELFLADAESPAIVRR